MSELHTTLHLLRQHDACEEGYVKCKAALGKGWGDNTPIPLSRILASNGIADTIWCFRALLDGPGWIRDYILDCAEHVLPIWEERHPGKSEPRTAIDTARRFLRGAATIEQVKKASAEASAAFAASASSASDFASSASSAAAAAAASASSASSAFAAAFASSASSASSAFSAYERTWQAKRLQEYLEGATP